MRVNAKVLLAANIVYFALASVSSVYCVSEAWHYGFWKAPFPLLLTLTALTYIGATTLGICCAFGTFARCLFLSTFMYALGASAASGAFWSPPTTIQQIHLIMFSLIGLQSIGMLAAYKNGLNNVQSQGAAHGSLIRSLALLLPLPIFALAGLQFYLCHTAGPAAVSNGTANVYIACQRVLFGEKRAHKLEEIAEHFGR